ncbi:stuck in traffic [Megalopta genalis]|uniref:stuck in traffic n=1 Tax=Megalopta genalis TaxID=115081 RepID=UPI0014437BD9|nr:elongation of very long chain fatty acids protein AAEL008004-like [Megalopta genalis]XP_033335529.1 elongation of very long chain fatty acids protein AAEL008004-like [Megalopta genalis]XP_033335530.1 elongation of very long chain fatty acids protein AAEL008004-like [Megalopta genalis]XP_033335531.1 elongation of very long chain fatty acids protein AAEL008004-like [Megalopta genalis]
MNISGTPSLDKMSNIYNNSAVRFYQYVFHDLSDPRTREWFMIASPVPGVSLLIGYLYFCLSWGPRQMEHRKPYKLRNVLVVYNFLQVLLSCWLFYEGLDGAWLRKYSWKCQPVDFSTTPEAMRVARGVYIYFLAKISELLDTVFFVLRKKDSQITFLHLYHHTVMPMISWGATKYYPGGHGTFIGVINSFVHIIMYTYYLLAALLPQYQKYLWWKKYITTLQMGQFCLAFLHSCQLLFYDCDYPKWSLFFILPNAIFFYFLFADFYDVSYQHQRDRKGSRPCSTKETDPATQTDNGRLQNGKGKTD